MKKIIKILIITGIIITALSGCGKENIVKDESEEVSMEQNNSAPLITKEYILEHGIATEEDMEKIDINKMIIFFGWYEGIENELLNFSDYIISFGQDFLLDDYVTDYSYLCTKDIPDIKLAQEDIANLKVFAYEYNENTYFESVLFDLEEKKAYQSRAGRSLLERQPMIEEYIELTDEQVKEIKDMIEKAHIWEWKQSYKGSDKNTTGWYWWRMMYELEDGRIYGNGGTGTAGQGTPKSQNVLEKEVSNFFKKLNN